MLVVAFLAYTLSTFAQELLIDGICYRLQDSKALIVRSTSTAKRIRIPAYVIYGQQEYPVTEVLDNAFEDSKCAHISLPNNIKKIGEEAFCDAEIKSIHLPKSLKQIGRGAFSGCSNLRCIILPDSIISIEKCTFQMVSNLKKVQLPKQLQYIGDYAFDDCKNLKKIKFNKSLKKIGAEAFCGCDLLKSIYIPDSVIAFNLPPFVHGSNSKISISKIMVSKRNRYLDSRNNCNAVINTYNNELILGCKNTIIPNTVRRIGYYAFLSCNKLRRVDIPESVEVIDCNAFEGCGELETVVVRADTIYTEAFGFCQNLKNVVLTDKVKFIGYGAFEGCNSLKTITIPRNVSFIGRSALAECNSLQEIRMENPIPIEISDAVFEYVHLFAHTKADLSKLTLSVPKGAKEAYSSAPVWKEFGEIVEF